MNCQLIYVAIVCPSGLCMGRRYSRYRRYQFCSWDREERNAFLVLWELDMRPSNLGKTYEIHCYSRTSSTSYHDSYHASADLVFSSPSQIQHLPDLHDSDLNHIAENGRHTKLDFCTQSSRRPEGRSSLLAHIGGRLHTTL